jgi:hypothetical protein
VLINQAKTDTVDLLETVRDKCSDPSLAEVEAFRERRVFELPDTVTGFTAPHNELVRYTL